MKCSIWDRALVCTCGLVKRHQSSPKYCSNSKFTSSQVQLKSPDVFLLHPFYQGCINRWLVRTWGSQVSQNAFRTNQRALMVGGKFCEGLGCHLGQSQEHILRNGIGLSFNFRFLYSIFFYIFLFSTEQTENKNERKRNKKLRPTLNSQLSI